MTRENGATGEQSLDAGVIGVGSMGAHHARVYSELPNVTLAAVADVDREQAGAVASRYGTRSLTTDDLVDRVDVATIAVPTANHYDVARECIDRGVDVLVEKPLVDDVERGHRLARRAREAGVTLQVGHIERFNPAVRALEDILPDLDVVAVDVQRLGPPLDRDVSDSVVYDLMVHDIDLLFHLLDSDIDSLTATAANDQHVSAQLSFADGSIGELTASRLTQQKVRTLAVTAMECRVTADFINQSVEIHRQSLPEYVEQNGDVRYRHESVVERPVVDTGNPLKRELQSFLDAVRDGTTPAVTAEDGLRVIEVADRIESEALGLPREVSQ
ncbi:MULTISPECIES: Gfo/Idh/MocA family oxidoreductase [Salinibaculum]|uniref:Gfo/Idh/MocA family oxidoreductase n=1 Tax=Salinibaculum TaxID=2732368 RepID=UPI0030CB5482